jgi:4-hydroxybenzoate polyprenyltransferase
MGVMHQGIVVEQGRIRIVGALWCIAIALLVLVKFVFGIAGALFHLLLVAAVMVVLYNLIKEDSQSG